MTADLSVAIEAVQNMVKGFVAQVPYIVAGLVVFFVFYFVSKLVRSLMRRFGEGRQSHLSLS